jgi:hypothetical protein
MRNLLSLSGWGVEIGIALDAALRHDPTGEPVVVNLLAVTRPDYKIFTGDVDFLFELIK